MPLEPLSDQALGDIGNDQRPDPPVAALFRIEQQSIVAHLGQVRRRRVFAGNAVGGDKVDQLCRRQLRARWIGQTLEMQR